MKDAIVKFLKVPRTAKEVADEFGLSSQKASMLLQWLHSKERVHRVFSGREKRSGHGYTRPVKYVQVTGEDVPESVDPIEQAIDLVMERRRRLLVATFSYDHLDDEFGVFDEEGVYTIDNADREVFVKAPKGASVNDAVDLFHQELVNRGYASKKQTPRLKGI